MALRTVILDLSSNKEYPKSFGGYEGENNATELSIILPANMLGADSYVVNFETSFRENIESQPILSSELIDNKLNITLWQQLMCPSFLIVQVFAYKNIENTETNETSTEIIKTVRGFLEMRKSINETNDFNSNPYRVSDAFIRFVNSLEDIENSLVTELSNSNTDKEIPSAKAVVDFSNDFHKENFKKGINKVKNQSFNIDRGDLIIFVDDFLFSVGSCFVFEPKQPYNASRITIVDTVNSRGVYTTGIFNLIDFGKTQNIYFELGKKYILTVSQITGTYTLELTIAVLSSNFSISGFDGNNYLSKTNNSEYTPTADYNPATKKYVDSLALKEHGTFTIQFTDNYCVSEITEQICTYTLLNENEAFIYMRIQGVSGEAPDLSVSNQFTGVPFAIDENLVDTPIPISYSYGLIKDVSQNCISFFGYSEGGVGMLNAVPAEANTEFSFVAQGVIKIK